MAKQKLGNGINRNIFFLFVYLICLSIEGNAEASLKLLSGDYWEGAAKIAVEGSHVTGSVNTSIGENENAVCQFYFSGEIINDSLKIQCQNFIDTENVRGTIIIQNESSFILKTLDNPGCSDRIADFVNDGQKMNLQKKSEFIQIRIIKSQKAYFYTRPSLQTKRKAYLLLGNEAQVTEKQKEWLKVTFGKTTGWMLEQDMFPLTSFKQLKN